MTALLLTLLAAGDTTLSLTADAATVRLSGVVRLTLTAEGPAPLRAEPPADLLDDESAGGWKLTPGGPPVTEALPDGRQRWTRRYVADPFLPGDGVRLGFAPVAVWAGGGPEPRRLTAEPLAVRVTTGVTDPSPAAARPVTGVEGLPDPPPAPGLGSRLRTAAAAVGLSLLVVVLIVRTGRRKRRAVPPAGDPFAGLADMPDAAFAHRLSDSVRDRLHTDALPARRLTTPELLAAAPDPDRLCPLLGRLDAVRFGGEALTAGERAAMLDAARTLVAPGAARVRAG